MILAIVLAGLRQGPFPWAYKLPLGPDGPAPTYFTVQDPAHADALTEALALVPDEAVVSATNHAGSHLSERRRILLFPYVDDAEWVVIDGKLPGISLVTNPLLFSSCLAGVNSSPFWTLDFVKDSVVVYRKVPNPSPDAFALKRLAPGATDPADCRIDLEDLRRRAREAQALEDALSGR
jgi:hypothetical protein